MAWALSQIEASQTLMQPTIQVYRLSNSLLQKPSMYSNSMVLGER